MKTEKTKKKTIAVWIDHTSSYFIKLKSDKAVVESIDSEYEPHLRIEGETPRGGKVKANRSTNNEHNKHQKEQKQLSKYYKKLTGKIAKYHLVYR